MSLAFLFRDVLFVGGMIDFVVCKVIELITFCQRYVVYFFLNYSKKQMLDDFKNKFRVLHQKRVI